MPDRTEYMRDCRRRLYEKRSSMGLCIFCGCMIDDHKYKTCSGCRSNQREICAKYREQKKEEKATFAFLLNPSEPQQPIIPENHKCWSCEWSKYEYDRFFCLFVEGTCAKNGTAPKMKYTRKTEEKHED